MAIRSTANLTDTKVRHAKPAAKAYKLPDGDGLHLAVSPTGAKCWRYRYRIGGKENVFAIGEYPNFSLREARSERDRARDLVKQGIHPAADRRARRLVASQSAENTFEALAKEWIDQHKSDWSATYLSQVQTVLAEDVFPDVGRLPIRSVHASQLLGILKRVEGRGAPTIAILIRQWVSAIFRYAVATLRAEVDPASALKGAVSKPKTKHKKPLRKSELSGFLEKMDRFGGTAKVEFALRLLLLTFVRPSELREAHWSEFDLTHEIWEIPGARMKMREPHVVPLSQQALDLLHRLKAVGGNRPLLFPNQRDPRRPMSPMTMNRSLERMGYSGIFSAHGFRATASTYLNSVGWRTDVIERQLAHQERNKSRASYNHAQYLEERKEMMQSWADYLDGLRQGATVTPIGIDRAS